jgi:serine/threonine-protein kinase
MDPASAFEGGRISGYEIQGKLGAGGMGVVYKAVDTKLGRTVALKFLPAEAKDADARERFWQEAKAASALDHPNIGTIHSIEETPAGRPFIVMAYYDGESLAQRIARGPLAWREAVGIAIRMGEALAAAHGKGIVHRDIKPANVMLTQEGAVKVVDFGLAKMAGSAALTQTGQAVGTADYMSPEQATGQGWDARSDIWAWGVVLYEMLTGRRPFEGATAPSLLYQVVHAEPRPLATGVPALEAVCRRAMAKAPADRYAGIADAVADLRRIAAGESLTSTMRVLHTVAPRRTRLPRRRWILLAATAVVAAAAAATPAVRNAAVRIWDGWHARHIAVLPFRTIGNDTAGAAVSDGLMEVLTSQLSAMEQGHRSFWVVPSEDVRRRNPKDAADAKRIFGVNRAVTGSVQRQGKAVTLTINLIDTGRGEQIGSAILGDPEGNLFQLQNAAVAELGRLLDVERSGSGKGAGTANAAAYAAYLEGLGYSQRYDKAGNLDAAIRLLQQGAEGGLAAAQAALGEAYWRKYLLTLDAQWIQRANEACQRALQADARLPAAHITMGRIREGTGQRDLAAEEYRRALELDARSAEATLGLARVAEALGRAGEADWYFRKAITLRPEYWGTYNGLANFYLRQNRYRDAEKQLEKILELVPDNAAIYINLGAARLKLDDLSGARKAFERSIELSPSYMAYSNLGIVANKEGRFEAGAASYEKALALNDKDYRVWGSLGHAYDLAGNRDKARPAYERAAQMAEAQVKIQPGDARAFSLLAFYDARLERKDAALEQIRHALALAPADADVELQAAEVYESLGLRQEALDWTLRYLAAGKDPAWVKRSPELRQLAEDPRVRQQLKGGAARTHAP